MEITSGFGENCHWDCEALSLSITHPVMARAAATRPPQFAFMPSVAACPQDAVPANFALIPASYPRPGIEHWAVVDNAAVSYMPPDPMHCPLNGAHTKTILRGGPAIARVQSLCGAFTHGKRHKTTSAPFFPTGAAKQYGSMEGRGFSNESLSCRTGKVTSVRNFSCILGCKHEKGIAGDTAIPPLAQVRPPPCRIPEPSKVIQSAS
uniref:WGS project CAEQ00000000 data, annotated contig 1735 n=1 Tax=Trypanosoma congolense (strain IL3000) TaxID=1068625 RepID=F9W8I2_TRYCI|nr:unnamed protein product [Trypanosoma congolense IL3000]